MTVIKINAITVPQEMGGEIARRFAERAGAVDGQEGFEGFELLEPTDGRDQWLVVTRWRDDESFEAWRSSESFAHGHRGTTGAGGEPGTSGGPGGGHPGGAPPVSMSAELWSYKISGGSAGA